MSAAPRRSLGRWLKSTSNRTFFVWPCTLLALEVLLARGWPLLQLWALPLLAWGYLQYRWVGSLRSEQGGGGPGISVPPQRIVTSGPYALVRNPMYLGHLIFLAGLAWLLSSLTGVLVLVGHALWFDRRVREDEARLHELFGPVYSEYTQRVKRWLPGLL